jgi:hypothetical protein
MIPMPYWEVARLIHEERIREAQPRLPEWMYEAAVADRPRQGAGASQHLRVSVAQALHRLAARVEPSGSTEQTARSRQPVSTP